MQENILDAGNSRGEIVDRIVPHFSIDTMFRRKRGDKVESPTANKDVEVKKAEICANCIKLMQENSQLKEQLAILQGEGKKKQYTINPTLYTFYKNNVQKNRISR